MHKKLFVFLPILSSLLFSCANVIYYDVKIVGTGFSHNGKNKADNLHNYEVTFTDDFGYILDDFIDVYCGESELLLNTHYTFNNKKLKITNKVINDTIKIIPKADVRDDSIFIHNFNAVKQGYAQNSTIGIDSGTTIDIHYGKDVVFNLYSISGKQIPADEQFSFNPSDQRFFKAGEVRFEERNQENTHVKITIPQAMLGCNITFNIPEVI